MLYTQSAREALLKWVNNGFPNIHAASTWADLADGILLSEVLQDLDPEYDAADIDREPPASTPKWLVKKKNLQALHRSLFRYINRECPELDPLVKSAVWRTLAEDPNEESLVKLVSIFVAVAFLGPNPAKYVSRLQQSDQFDQNTKIEIQQIIMEKDNEMKKAAAMADAEDALDQIMDGRDAGLAFEEERATLISQIEVAKKQHADTITRLEHLQDSYDTLRLEESKLQRELEVLRKATQDGASDTQIIKSLEDKIMEQDELISTQESQVEDDRVVKEKLRLQVAALAQKAERAEHLEDELSVLNHSVSELSRKANAAERLKQKLEQQRDLATEVKNLRFEKDELLKKMQEADRLEMRIVALEKTLEEVRSSHAQAEESVFLLTGQKRMLEETYRAERDEVARLNELRTHDERFIAELQEQVGLHHAGGQSLEDELEGTPVKPQLLLELSRVKAENALLRHSADTGETSQLRLELEDEQRKMAELQARYTEIVEQHSVAQDQVSALVNDAAGEGTRAFDHLRSQLLQTTADLQASKQRTEVLEAKVADGDRELLMARAELSAAAKGGTEAIEELRATDGLVSTSLREELDLARARNRSLASELEMSKSQVIEAFVAKDKFRKELDELTGVKDRVEDKGISDETIAQDVGKMAEKIEKLRERLRQRQEQLEKSEHEKYELQRKLKTAMATGGSSSAQKAAAEQTIKNLQRENALIASAWYDLTSRLQSNHVVLQRRAEAPKSWLNKQRHLVNATPRR